MAHIKASDSVDLPHPTGIVHFVLQDFRAYGEWWPKPVRITMLENDRAMRIQNGRLVIVDGNRDRNQTRRVDSLPL